MEPSTILKLEKKENPNSYKKMGTIILTNFFAKFINISFPIFYIIWVSNQQTLKQFYEQQTAMLDRNKSLGMFIMFVIWGVINSLIQYEKYLTRKSDRLRVDLENKKLDLENKLMEQKIKDNEIKTD